MFTFQQAVQVRGISSVGIINNNFLECTKHRYIHIDKVIENTRIGDLFLGQKIIFCFLPLNHF